MSRARERYTVGCTVSKKKKNLSLAATIIGPHGRTRGDDPNIARTSEWRERVKPRAWRAHEEGSPTQYLSARAGGETTGYRSDDQLHRLSYLRPPRKRGWVKRTFSIQHTGTATRVALHERHSRECTLNNQMVKTALIECALKKDAECRYSEL